MNSFFIEEWEVWHSYSTYMKNHVENIEKVAELLVDLEISDCSVISNGETFCRTSDGVAIGRTTIELSGDFKEASVKFNSHGTKEDDLTSYAKESWLTCSRFLHGEARQFSPVNELTTIHLRSILRPIRLIKNEEAIVNIYPVLVLYTSGVLIIEFRTLSPSGPINIDDFITNHVNMYQYNYDYAFVSPNIGVLALEADQAYSSPMTNFIERLARAKDKRNYKRIFEMRAEKINFGDFDFEMIPLSMEEGGENITSLATALFKMVGLLIEKPTSDATFLFKGIPGLPEMAKYYIGRPHVHIIRHSDQQDKASANEDLHKESFGRILARIPETPGEFSKLLPSSSRKLNDLSAYIMPGMTLWIWSKKGLEEQEKSIDINSGDLIYERQVQVELLEYGFMLHKIMVEKSSKLKNCPEILATRRDLVNLKSKMVQATPYGEVRDLLAKGWEAMNLAVLQTQISDNLSILESEMKIIESKKSDDFRLFITIFGLIGSAAFAKSIVLPLWKVFYWWLPFDSHVPFYEDKNDLFLIFVSSLFIIFLSIGLKKLTYK
jgi:hypothetical protein